MQHIKTITIQNINCKLLSIIIFYFWYYTETRIESNMDRAHVYIPLTQLHWSIRLGAGPDRTWFEDTPLSQLARGIYYFARNQFEHAKWLRGRTRCIPNNYLGRIPWESRLGQDPKIPFVKFSLIAFPLFFKPSLVPARIFRITFVRRQRQTIKALHHWFGQFKAENKENWDTT